jgi:hypothetical protein
MDFVSENLVTRMGLHIRMSSTKSPMRFVDGQRVASTKVCDISFTVAQHGFVRKFRVLRDLRAADIV